MLCRFHARGTRADHDKVVDFAGMRIAPILRPHAPDQCGAIVPVQLGRYVRAFHGESQPPAKPAFLRPATT